MGALYALGFNRHKSLVLAQSADGMSYEELRHRCAMQNGQGVDRISGQDFVLVPQLGGFCHPDTVPTVQQRAYIDEIFAVRDWQDREAPPRLSQHLRIGDEVRIKADPGHIPRIDPDHNYFIQALVANPIGETAVWLSESWPPGNSKTHYSWPAHLVHRVDEWPNRAAAE